MPGPVRTCISCRAKKHPNELIRFNLDADHSLTINARARTGRSFYICQNRDCLNSATAKDACRVLKSPVTAEALATAIQNPLCQQR
ncbi:hypothetical protein CCB80_06685 [Armatimonadetes bacterium Uphvl-Ar1]|nr:hypothetical protein CCB80_06685 [Armatimonadetes bacterium Uphvl-Ar1]